MSRNDRMAPVAQLFAGLFGCAGVALAAAAAHGSGDGHLLASASAMCLAHAPALLSLSLAGERLRTAWLASFLMILGTLLFAGDLICLRFAGQSLFPYAAPTGGWAMMAGWLAAGAGAFTRRRG